MNPWDLSPAPYASTASPKTRHACRTYPMAHLRLLIEGLSDTSTSNATSADQAPFATNSTLPGRRRSRPRRKPSAYGAATRYPWASVCSESTSSNGVEGGERRARKGSPEGSRLRGGLMPDQSPTTSCPLDLKLRFRRAGLGNGRGARTTPEAEQLFLRSVPRWVRSSGERAVKAFLKDKHASHIESVANAPGKAKIMGNMVWESRKRNWSRGPRNMTGVDRLRAHAKNGVHAARLGAKGFGAQLGKAAAFAALLELPVSAVENTIRVVKGSVSGKDAAKQTAKNTATAGAIGGVTAVGITGAVALGAGPAVTALSPIVAPAGAAIYVISAFRRIGGAVQESRPFEPMTLYFHETCYGQFASGMSTGSEDDGDGPGASPCGRPSDHPRAPSGGRLAGKPFTPPPSGLRPARGRPH